MGISIFSAREPVTAAAMAEDISLRMPLAITMPTGPRITSARAALQITAFSPVAP